MSWADRWGSFAAQQVLAVQLLLDGDRLGVDAEQPTGRDAQEPVQAGLGGDHPAQLGPLGLRQLVGVGDHLLQPRQQLGADGGVAVGGVGVVADHEPFVLADLDFLDPQGPGDVVVAAGPAQRGGRLGGAGAQLLAQEVAAAGALQVAPVLRRSEAAVGDPDHPR